jgi:hypothetical protein
MKATDHIIRFELTRAFRNRLFLLALGLGCLIALSHIIFDVMPSAAAEQANRQLSEAKGAYPLSLFNTWMGGKGYIIQPTIYFFLLPLLVCIPFADTLSTDRQSGYIRHLATRANPRRYYLAKTLSVFLSAAAVGVLPLLLDFYLTALFFPPLIPEATSGQFPIGETSMFSGLFYSHPFAYVAVYLLIIALFSGLFALFSLVFTFFIKNRALVMLSPFILCAFIDFILGVLPGRFFQFSPILFLRPDQPGIAVFTVIGAEFLILLSSIILFLLARGSNNESY